MTKTKHKLLAAFGVMLTLSLGTLLCGFTTDKASAFAEEAAPCEHAYMAETVAATCKDKGYTLYTCENCGDSYKDDYTELKEHTYSDIVIAPTCTNSGYTTHFCVECGAEYTDEYKSLDILSSL